MRPISRLAAKRASSFPSLCCTAFRSASPGRRPVTPVSKAQCRHKSKVRTNPPPVAVGGKTFKAMPTTQARRPTEPASAVEAQVFTQVNVPGVEFLRSQLASLGPSDLTLEQCLEAARLYCDGDPKRDSAWAKRLISETNITPYTLHYLGIMLAYPYTNPTHDLGWNMLVTANTLDYVPSTLQLILHLEHTNPQATRPKDFKPNAAIRSAIAKHQILVRTGRDPSALALQGHLLASTGNQTAAADMFDKAWRVGTSLAQPTSPPTGPPPRKPRWLLEGTCHLVHGQRMLEQGKRPEAEACVRIAALELDQPQAYAALAKIVADPAERAEFALKAAMSGIKSACESMARAGAKEAEEHGLSAEERRTRILMAKEWAMLVGP